MFDMLTAELLSPASGAEGLEPKLASNQLLLSSQPSEHKGRNGPNDDQEGQDQDDDGRPACLADDAANDKDAQQRERKSQGSEDDSEVLVEQADEVEGQRDAAAGEQDHEDCCGGYDLQQGQHTMRFGSTAKVLAECMLKYLKISGCSSSMLQHHCQKPDDNQCP